MGHTFIVDAITVKTMKVPDKPKGILASQCMAKKPMEKAQAVSLIQLLG